MHRGWLLLPAFIISAVSIIGLLNDVEQPTSGVDQCRSVQKDYKPQTTVLVTITNSRQGYPVDINQTARKLISADQLSAIHPLTPQEFNTLPPEAIWADNIPAGTTIELTHILQPNDSGYQAIADVRNHIAYPLIIEQQLISKQLIKPGVRVDITLISGVSQQSGRSSYAHDATRLLATTVATYVLITDIQPIEKPIDNNPLVTVTLSVAPESVKKLMLARRAGVLELTPSAQSLTDDLAMKEALPSHIRVTELRGKTIQAQGGTP